MKIVIDDKIPYISETLALLVDEVVALPGSRISAADVRDADALIVRTRTRCDENLLSGSKVSFVATATIGFDHIDTQYLEQSGIEWMSCPGCNSSAVAQYVRSSLLLLIREKGIVPSDTTIGIVGCGHVGSKVKALAEDMGFSVMVCDPPKAESGEAGTFVDISDIAAGCDIITFHVPYTTEGRYPTLHLADAAFFDSLRCKPWIINTSRGEVVETSALLRAIDCGQVTDAVIDTWENEPDINLTLLNKVYIGTPHIAGYSAEGKVNADNMVVDGLCRHFGLELPSVILPPPLPEGTIIPESGEERMLALYNPLADSGMLKASPESFEELRGNYPVRRET